MSLMATEEPKSSEATKRTRLIIDTTERIRKAVRVRYHQVAAAGDEDATMSDVVNQILEEALQEELEAIDARDKPKRR